MLEKVRSYIIEMAHNFVRQRFCPYLLQVQRRVIARWNARSFRLFMIVIYLRANLRISR